MNKNILMLLCLTFFGCVNTKLGNIRPNVKYISIYINSNKIVDITDIQVEIYRKKLDNFGKDTIDNVEGFTFRANNNKLYNLSFSTPIYSNSIVKIRIKDKIYLYDKFQIEKVKGTFSIIGSSYEYFMLRQCELNGVNYEIIKKNPFQIKFE